MVKKNGFYHSQGEASRAANAVFGTIKSRLSPAASNDLRQALPGDAARLWQYSPVALRDVEASRRATASPVHAVLRVQQLGRYATSAEAHRALRSVLCTLGSLLPNCTERLRGESLWRDEEFQGSDAALASAKVPAI
jgi:uncharacterized protein (DUF2267 family)